MYLHNFDHALNTFVYVEAILHGWIKGLPNEIDLAFDDIQYIVSSRPK
jgi:hypothetical protein